MINTNIDYRLAVAYRGGQLCALLRFVDKRRSVLGSFFLLFFWLS